jgi:hypothetical protein
VAALERALALEPDNELFKRNLERLREGAGELAPAGAGR